MNGPGEMADADYGYDRSRRRTRQPFTEARVRWAKNITPQE